MMNNISDMIMNIEEIAIILLFFNILDTRWIDFSIL